MDHETCPSLDDGKQPHVKLVLSGAETCSISPNRVPSTPPIVMEKYAQRERICFAVSLLQGLAAQVWLANLPKEWDSNPRPLTVPPTPKSSGRWGVVYQLYHPIRAIPLLKVTIIDGSTVDDVSLKLHRPTLVSTWLLSESLFTPGDGMNARRRESWPGFHLIPAVTGRRVSISTVTPAGGSISATPDRGVDKGSSPFRCCTAGQPCVFMNDLGPSKHHLTSRYQLMSGYQLIKSPSAYTAGRNVRHQFR
jgi:hypothetical protein